MENFLGNIPPCACIGNFPLSGKFPRGNFSYRPLHCTALHCTALHCTALHCTALHFTSLHCTALHCTALHCTALHCTALQCYALNCTTLNWNTMQRTAIHYTALNYTLLQPWIERFRLFEEFLDKRWNAAARSNISPILERRKSAWNQDGQYSVGQMGRTRELKTSRGSHIPYQHPNTFWVAIWVRSKSSG